ncbi:MAG TPA: ABC transporter permease [Vicinamibacterales bacterium]|jgi:putative ABC transport system permease protein|nr:ABC transporter permease [Vicinamibacterales bacterium]
MRQALKGLARRPGFAVVAVVTLALGLGASAAIFSVIDAALLRPLPFPEADRLVMPWEYSADFQQRLGLDRLPSSPGNVVDFRARNTTLSALASMRADRATITGGGDPERVAAVKVSVEFFHVLGITPIAGRTFAAADVGAGPAVVIGEGLWRRRFAASPDIQGRQLVVNGQPTAVIGVMPAAFRFPSAGELPEAFGFSSKPELWNLDVLTPEQRVTRAGKSFAMVARLRPDVSAEEAEADLQVIAAQIAREHPDFNAGWTVRVLPLREQLVGTVRPALFVLMAAVGFVLLIACTNVANLLLVRAASRQRELCIRTVLGATRRRLVGELLAESVALSLAAALLGALIGWWGLRALLALLPATPPAIADATLDLRVFAFTTAVAVATGVLFGLLPAFQGSRAGVEGLRDGGRGTVGGRRSQVTRNVLVIGEVALASVLLVSAALLLQTFVRLLRVETGFRAEGVLTMELALPPTVYSPPQAADFFARLTERLSAIPGVLGAGATSSLPLAGRETLQPVTIEGRPRARPGFEIVADYRLVTPGYFEAMGIQRVDGEIPRDSAAPAPLAVINETMARTHWGGENPIGRRVKLTSYDRPGPWFTVAAIVRDARHTALDGALRPQVYVHYRLDPWHQMWAVIRAAGDPAALGPAARAAVYAVDPNQPVSRMLTMPDVVAASVSDRRFSMTLVGIFAGLALALSVVGLYAVVSYSVAERIQEMGLRLALGAQPSNLLAMVLGEGFRLVTAGLALGIAGAWALTRFLDTLLFGVDARDAATFAGVVLVLGLAALLGCLVPALRAMRVDPMVALRAE